MFLRLLSFVLLITPLYLSASQWRGLSSLLPKGAQVSYLVVDPVNDHVIAQYLPSVLRIPASMQKLLTATAAKLYLGKDFRYYTTIDGQKKRLVNNRYQGNLRFNFSGDPTLLRTDIRTMVYQLKRLGIRQIVGNLLLNQAHFNGYQWSNGQAWNDLGVCYTAPTSAIIINRNCVLGNLGSRKNTLKARLFIPDYEPIKITSDVLLVSPEEQREQFCDLEMTRNDYNNYQLWGCMVRRDRPLPLSIAINDPFTYAQNIIAAELAKAGILLTGKVINDNQSEKSPAFFSEVLVSHQSSEIAVLLKTMLKDSDNLIADSLFKTLGATYFRTSGNFRNGGQALKLILKEQGIDLENAQLADGSGLSRHNLISAELFMKVLKYVYKNEHQLKLLGSFSIAGVDGTLKHYHGLSGHLFNGKVIAKTGSMQGVSNLLGVMNSPQGDRLFVLILNAYKSFEAIDSDQQQKRQVEPKYIFQQAFFKKMIQS